MKASDYIAKKISTFTNHVFSGQGGSVVHILDSLSKIKKVKIIPSQNEQGAFWQLMHITEHLVILG